MEESNGGGLLQSGGDRSRDGRIGDGGWSGGTGSASGADRTVVDGRGLPEFRVCAIEDADSFGAGDEFRSEGEGVWNRSAAGSADKFCGGDGAGATGPRADFRARFGEAFCRTWDRRVPGGGLLRARRLDQSWGVGASV